MFSIKMSERVGVASWRLRLQQQLPLLRGSRQLEYLEHTK